MRVLSEKEESRQLILEIEAEAAEMERALEVASRRVAKRARVPGFRPGKAPRGVVERYLGRDALIDEAAKDFVPTTYEQAVAAREVKAFGLPKFEVFQRDPLAFRAIVPLEPVVEPGDYRNLSHQVDPAPVTEEQVAEALERLRYEEAPWEPAPAAVKMGDLVTIDVEGRVEERVVTSQQGVEYLVQPQPPVPLPGFAAQLEGMLRDEEKEFTLPFPEDYPQPELQGKEGSFRVRVREIKERKPLPLDDELAKNLGWESLSSLREGVATRLRSRAEAEARRQLEDQVTDSLLAGARVEFSPLMVDREIERLIRERNLRDEERVREELRPLATRRIALSLLLEKVAAAEGIEVGEEEVAAEVARMSQGQGGEEMRRFFGSQGARQALRETLLTRKTIARLVELATGSGGEAEERGKAE